MADAVTTYYSWSYPTNGADASTWGTTLNTTIQAIDSQMHLMATLASPTFTGTVNGAALNFTGTSAFGGVVNITAGTLASSANAVVISSNDGGAGEGAQVSLVNSYASATTPRKYIRLNNSGNFQILNSAYTSTLLDISDAGVISANSPGYFSGSLTGAVTGNVTGNVSGSSGSCTGNAATATTATTATNQSGGTVNATTGAFSGLVSINAGADNTPAATPSATAVGYLGTPLNAQNANYTFVMADAGKLVKCNSASAVTYTIPPSASVAFPVGTVIVVRNIGAGTLTIALGSGITLYKAGSGSQASAAISQFGLASLLYEGGNWLISGVNVT